MIYNQNSQSEHLYLLVEGTVVMLYGNSDGVLTNIYSSGSFFGEIELMTNSKRYFTCLAVSDCVIYTFQKKNLQSIFFQQFPRLGQAFNQIVKIRSEAIHKLFSFLEELISKEEERKKRKMFGTPDKHSLFQKKFTSGNSDYIQFSQFINILNLYSQVCMFITEKVLPTKKVFLSIKLNQKTKEHMSVFHS